MVMAQWNRKTKKDKIKRQNRPDWRRTKELKQSVKKAKSGKLVRQLRWKNIGWEKVEMMGDKGG